MMMMMSVSRWVFIQLCYVLHLKKYFYLFFILCVSCKSLRTFFSRPSADQCAGGAVVSALYCHVEFLGSIPGRGKIYMQNSVSVAHPAHSAVMSRPGLYLVEGKAARE